MSRPHSAFPRLPGWPSTGTQLCNTSKAIACMTLREATRKWAIATALLFAKFPWELFGTLHWTIQDQCMAGARWYSMRPVYCYATVQPNGMEMSWQDIAYSGMPLAVYCDCSRSIASEGRLFCFSLPRRVLARFFLAAI